MSVVFFYLYDNLMSISPLNKTLGALPDCPNAYTDNIRIISTQTQLFPFSFACVATYNSPEWLNRAKELAVSVPGKVRHQQYLFRIKP